MPKIERLVFFGTPEFALPTLEALCDAERTPRLVVSQPDRPAGRGRRLQAPPVARWARQRELEVVQPERVGDGGFLELLEEVRPSIAVVVAFGQIFGRRLLELPALGCLNLHASLLPRYRGAAPVQAAIAAGERTTGVTTMVMERGLDTGPILLQQELEIGERETSGELAPRLAGLGAELMVETLAGLERGDLIPRPQRHEEATLAPLLKKRDGRVDWNLRSRELFNLWRAYTPWPGLVAECREQPVRLLQIEPLGAPGGGAASPGTVLGLREGRLAVACGSATLLGIASLQRPGRRALSAADFLNGERLAVGERFT